MIAVTPRAAEVLRVAVEAARRFDPHARIRLRREGERVAFEFTDGPHDGDATVDIDGVPLIVEAGLDGTVDAGEHNVLTML
jgi:Fe-S cluster assembly iron-binding protein IscA